MTRTELIAEALYDYSLKFNPTRNETMYSSYRELTHHKNHAGEWIDYKNTMDSLANIIEESYKAFPDAFKHDLVEIAAAAMGEDYYPVSREFEGMTPDQVKTYIDNRERLAAMGVYIPKSAGFAPWEEMPKDIQDYWRNMAYVGINKLFECRDNGTVVAMKRQIKSEKL